MNVLDLMWEYLPILYNSVVWPGIKTSIFSRLAVLSHYHQVSTGLHAVFDIHVLIEIHFQWVVLISVGCGK